MTSPAPTETPTLSLHDALPIWADRRRQRRQLLERPRRQPARYRACIHLELLHRRDPAVDAELLAVPDRDGVTDRKSTRLNSSHQIISYAVFCLKKNTLIAVVNV